MRIETIEISNYRQYKSVTFSFPKAGNYDLHIIKGKNGMGKTNLLNAITWCLYNKEPHLGIANSGKPKINTEALSEAKFNNINKIDVSVRVTISDDGNIVIFNRKQEIGTEDGFEYQTEFSVTEMKSTGSTKVYDDRENCDRYVNLYMLESIREYFFFDGEHLEKYFISEQGEKIKNAIHVISQVRLLSSMKNRLKTVIDDYNGDAGKKNKDISGMLIRLKEYETRKKSMDSETSKLQQQIAISKNVIIECSEFLRGKDGVPDKEREFNELQEEIKLKSEEKVQIIIEIHKFVRRYKTLFNFYPAIKETYDIICQKELEGVLPPSIDTDFLKRMLTFHKCLVCERDLGKQDEERVELLLEHISITSKASSIFHSIKSELENLIEEAQKYPDIKEKLLNKKKLLEDLINKSETKLNSLDYELKRFTDKEKIKEFHLKRVKNTEFVDVNQMKLASYQIASDKLCKEIEEERKLIEKARSSNEEFEELNRKINFAKNASDIVEEIEKEMMDDVREKITLETMSIFQELEWKKESFKKIELSEQYKIEMYDDEGYPTIGTCSAGERALLALSFTLALQKVAGDGFMLFIDTPVGRIDTENRRNFANVLRHVSKNKQVIITLTTSEYSKEIQNVFEPINSSFVELVAINEKETILEEV